MTEPTAAIETDPAAQLEALRQFSGDVPAFWKQYLRALMQLGDADAGFLLSRDTENEADWQKRLSEYATATEPPLPDRDQLLLSLATEAATHGQAVLPVSTEAGTSSLVAVSLDVGNKQAFVGAFHLPGRMSEPEMAERLLRLRLASDRGAWHQNQQGLARLQSDLGTYQRILDVTINLYEQERFNAACFTFCNEVAHRFDCDQAVLGFLVNNQFMRLQTISRTAKFDKKMAIVHALENLMEEAVDQEQEVVYPRPPGHFTVTREHEQFAREQGINHLVTLPLRIKSRTTAALVVYRNEKPFTEPEIHQLALTGALGINYLSYIREKDRFFLVRWAHRMRRSLSRLVGYEHTWVKLLAIGLAGVLAALIFIDAPYRVEAPFIIKAEEMSHITAPFDGYIQTVSGKIGDHVAPGQVLIALNRKDLLLEQRAARADLQRYQREAEKALAENRLAEMQINEARAAQSQARLDQIDYRLTQAEMKAPFDAVIVEGEWKDKVNAPVTKGDLLLRVAHLDSLYATLHIEEKDITYIDPETATGRIAFASDPRSRFPIALTRVHPAALSREGSTFFEARADFTGSRSSWWRPGMSGLAKIDVGERPLWWIFTHDTADFLRRKFWW